MKQHGNAIEYEEHGDDDARARWLLSLVEASPNRLAVIPIQRTKTDEQLDHIEDLMIRAYDIAKRDRPNLVVKLIPPLADMLPTGQRVEDVALLTVIHEHEYVRGECIHGCTRPL